MSDARQNELKAISDEAVEAATGYMDYLVRHGIISIADTDLTATLAEHIQSAITKALQRAEISVSEDKQVQGEKEADVSADRATIQKACEEVSTLLFPRRVSDRIPLGSTRQNATAYMVQVVESFLLPAVRLAEWGWSIIANAGGGDWTKESADWQEAAGKYRDDLYCQFGKLLSEHAPKSDSGSEYPQTVPVDRRDSSGAGDATPVNQK